MDSAEAALSQAISSAATATLVVPGLLQPSDGAIFFDVPSTASHYSTELREGEQPLVLIYFAIRGLGEGVRLLLAEAGAAYKSLALTGGEEQSIVCEWRSVSPTGLLPLVSGLGVPRAAPLSQSSSIMRFLARRLGLDGADELERCAADVLFETAKDLGAHSKELADAAAEPTEGAKGPNALALRVEKQLATMPSPSDAAAVMNYGQIQLANVLLSLEERAPNAVARLSAPLDAFRLAISQRPRIAAYLASPLRFPPTCADMGLPGGYDYATGPKQRSEFVL